MNPEEMKVGWVYHVAAGDYMAVYVGPSEDGVSVVMGNTPRESTKWSRAMPRDAVDRPATPAEANAMLHGDDVCTCGRRMHEFGPWDHEENLDYWRRDRWNADDEAVRAEHARDDAARAAAGQGAVHRGPWNDRWLWGWGPARSCSFCGGVHPGDALKLLREGWEVETTGKSYKRYLHPPGWSTWCNAFSASIKDPNREPGQGVPSIWEPTPPVKLYVQHMSDAEIAEFNAIVEARRKPPA